MNIATIGHLDYKDRLKQIPVSWMQEQLIVSPELKFSDSNKYYFLALKLTAQEIMTLPQEIVRQKILEAALFAQDEFDVELVQLGGLTTSVTRGGEWLVDQKEYTGFVNHGDSYTASVACKAVLKILKINDEDPSNLILAIVGSYGIIGEVVSKIFVPQFSHSILIGPRKEKLLELEKKIQGVFEITTELKTKEADIIITATSHPAALLQSSHLRKNAIIVDVSQPPNLTQDVCKKRPDIHRIDGGYVDFPKDFHIPGFPTGKIFACIAEAIMQGRENEYCNHVGTIVLNHLKKTETWAEKYGYTLKELTNFGETIKL